MLAIDNLPAFSQQVVRQKIWVLWIAILALVLGVHLLTLTLSPTVWIDEANMVEHGRIFLDPSSDWSILWSGKPIYLITYLGVLFQELAFRISQSMVGPRLLSTVGGLLSGTFALAYLRTCQVPQKIAFLLAVLLVLEPMFVQSYRGARVDSWAIAFCLGACWLLRIAGECLRQGKSVTQWVILAGSLAAASQFVWISAPMLMPLMLVEGLTLLQRAHPTSASRRTGRLYLAGVVILAWMGTTALLMLPILPHLTVALQDLQLLSTINNTLRERGNLITELKTIFSDIASTYKLDPLLLIVFGAGLFYTRDRKLFFVSLLVIGLTLSTKVYMLRCIYLLPYVVCVVGSVFNPHHSPAKGQKWMTRIVSLTLLWCIVFSLILRPVNALTQAPARNPNLLSEAGQSLVGRRSENVYLSDPELYYVGRSLGWKMYTFYGVDFGQYSPGQAVATMGHSIPRLGTYPKIDAVVTAPKTLQHPSCPVTVCQLIQKLGFQAQKEVHGASIAPASSSLPLHPYATFSVYRAKDQF
jgi:hypothetical protein